MPCEMCSLAAMLRVCSPDWLLQTREQRCWEQGWLCRHKHCWHCHIQHCRWSGPQQQVAAAAARVPY